MKKKMIHISLLIGFFVIANTTKGMFNQVQSLQKGNLNNMQQQQNNTQAGALSFGSNSSIQTNQPTNPNNNIQQQQNNTQMETTVPGTIFDQERHYRNKIKYQKKIVALQLAAIELANVFNQFNRRIQELASSSDKSQAKWMQLINNENNKQGYIQRVAQVTNKKESDTVGGAHKYMQQQYEIKNNLQVLAN